jgi:hypothetical protein
MMLIAKSLVLLLKMWGNGELDAKAFPQSLMYQDIPRTLLDVLARTMRSQQEDGSWESKREVTAYAVLTLEPLLSLPWVEFLRPEGVACMFRGKAYLEHNRNQWRAAERIWVEKTVYGSANLSQAYCLAACKTVVPSTIICAKVSDMFPSETTKKIGKMLSFFAPVHPFAHAPKWQLQLSLAQSVSYTLDLKAHRHDIFPPIEGASDEKYQEYIPFTWLGCRDHLSSVVPARTLWDMMLVSMFNFQVDAFMETVARDHYDGRLHELKVLIHSMCGEHSQEPGRTAGDETKIFFEHALNGMANDVTEGVENRAANVDDQAACVDEHRGQDESVKDILTNFVNFALHHPKVMASPAPLRRWLAHELQTFLLAHITHMEDCDALLRSANSSKGSVTWSKPRTTFFNWVRTTSADHTSCPYSFVFFLCLIGESGSSLDFNLCQRYALEDACRHLAAMCRQYNDLGSVARDQEEGNLNSVNFPEFAEEEVGATATVEKLIDRKKRDLFAVAEYERRCLERVLGELEKDIDGRIMEKLKLLIQVTNLYGQIYMVRDIGVRRAEVKSTK